MTDHTALRTERHGRVLQVTLDRPKANAIDAPTSRRMGEVFAAFRDDPELRVAIVNPGATRTEMRARAYPGEDPASLKPPEIVADRLVSLLSEQFSTGHRETVNQP